MGGLRCDEHGGDAEELQRLAPEHVGGEETVDVGDGEVESVGDELVLLGDLNEPVDEDGAHVGRHVHLHRGDVVRRRTPLRLRLQLRIKCLRVRTDPAISAAPEGVKQREERESRARRAYLHGAQVGVDGGGVVLAELRVLGNDEGRRLELGVGLRRGSLGRLGGAVEVLLGSGLDFVIVVRAERGVGERRDGGESDTLALGGDGDSRDGGGALGGGAGERRRYSAGRVLLVGHGLRRLRLS
jgi:hypothetical protein